jgi:hypothetical protein
MFCLAVDIEVRSPRHQCAVFAVTRVSHQHHVPHRRREDINMILLYLCVNAYVCIAIYCGTVDGVKSVEP